MLTPEYLLTIDDGITTIASQMERYVIFEIVKRLMARASRGEDLQFTAYDKWQMQVMEEAGVLYKDVVKVIAKYTGYGQTEIKRALLNAGITSIQADTEALYNAGKGIDALFPVFVTKDAATLQKASELLMKRSPYCIRAMERAYNATNGDWLNFTQSQAYTATNRFIEACDRAYIKTTSGAVSYTQAIKEEVEQLAKNGTTIVVNPATGHKDHVDVAAARCVRTGVSQMTAEITTARMDELDVDLVLVSAHLGARPEHEKWQGKVYSRKGKTEKYEDFVTATGYGTGEGLCGWNCRHSFSPFLEGMHNPYEDNPIDTEENNKRYEVEQEQRRLERTIRALKRQIEAYKAASSATKDEEIGKKLETAKGKLQEAKADYTAHCAEYDLRPMTERLKANYGK